MTAAKARTRLLVWAVVLCALAIILFTLWKFALRPPNPGSQNFSDGSPYPWRIRFEKIYRLDPGETVRLIPPPYIPERRLFINADWRTPGADFDDWQLSFFYDDSTGLRRHTVSVLTGTLLSAVRDSSNLAEADIDVADDLRNITVRGDWIVRSRSAATLDQRMAACQRILRAVTNRNIVIEKTKRLKDVYVLTGTYALKPHPQASDKTRVQLFIEEFVISNRPGGDGDGEFAQFIERLHALTGYPIINNSPTPLKTQTRWANHPDVAHARNNPQAAAMLLMNVARQTNLAFTSSTQQTDVWTVREQK